MVAKGNKGRAEPLPEGEREGKRGGRAAGRRGRVRMLLLTLLAASLGAMVWVYFFTDTLNVKRVEIYGNCNLDPDYLRSISGVTPRTHLLKMDVKAVEKAVLAEPYVLRVEVRRRFPHTVVLKVMERTPIGYLVQNGRFHLVDGEGLVLESTDRRRELPEITGFDIPLLYPGKRIEDPRFQGLAAILAEWPEDNGVRVGEAGYAEGEGYYLLVEGTKVIFGDQSDCRRKTEIAMAAILEVAPRYGGLRYVDVTYPDHPAIKPR
ncbi:MAG: FtsQ-type POTRA domain-containing protein [Actinobacteria bacterium]|nr:FtsQ-type POTRA domain-containing protein [Actinomycetota bacterium]